MTSFVRPDHDWTFYVGDWRFGLYDLSMNSSDGVTCKTWICLGSMKFVFRGASVFQVVGILGIIAALLIGLTVFLVTHRRVRRPP